MRLVPMLIALVIVAIAFVITFHHYLANYQSPPIPYGESLQ